MDTIDDGGPAFPTSNGGSPDDGMTLRDYFAAKALCGYYANSVTAFDTAEDAAEAMYAMADAMLKARHAPR